MPVNLSIKNAPDELVAVLRAKAKQNHRSLQGELLAMLQEHLAQMDWRESAGESAQFIREARDRDFVVWPRTRRILTVPEVRERMRRLGVKTPGDVTEIIRKARDER